MDYIVKIEDFETNLKEVCELNSLNFNCPEKIVISSHHHRYANKEGPLCCDHVFSANRPAGYEYPSYLRFYDDPLKQDVYEIYRKDFLHYDYCWEHGSLRSASTTLAQR